MIAPRWQGEYVFDFEEIGHPWFGDVLLFGEYVVGANYYKGSPRVMYLPDGSGDPGEPDSWEWAVTGVFGGVLVASDTTEEVVDLNDFTRQMLCEIIERAAEDEDMQCRFRDGHDWDDDGSDEKYDRWKDGEL
tara:strand:- start:508 stop:906 length:399 start_codon:yes stop_codon:yes gene_type:complete